MSSILSRPTLVLNKNWQAIRVATVAQSFVKAASGKAKLLDETSLLAYTWEEWINQFSLSSEDKPEDWGFCFSYIRTTKLLVRAPEIVIFDGYNKIPKLKVRLTRKNLLIRDRFRCAYTNKKLSSKDATIDHVIPRSKGGKTVWDNVVICSVEANVRKANRTPEEARMPLLHKPRVPIWNPMYTKCVDNYPESWKQFVNTDQWNEIGYWDVELVD